MNRINNPNSPGNREKYSKILQLHFDLAIHPLSARSVDWAHRLESAYKPPWIVWISMTEFALLLKNWNLILKIRVFHSTLVSCRNWWYWGVIEEDKLEFWLRTKEWKVWDAILLQIRLDLKWGSRVGFSLVEGRGKENWALIKLNNDYFPYELN